MFTAQMFTAQMFTVQMFTVQMFIVRVHSSMFIVHLHSSMFIVCVHNSRFRVQCSVYIQLVQYLLFNVHYNSLFNVHSKSLFNVQSTLPVFHGQCSFPVSGCSHTIKFWSLWFRAQLTTNRFHDTFFNSVSRPTEQLLTVIACS